ncbi:3-oxoacyl-[acyl-carrier-protein] reductase FabG [Halotydeus destructor]|nr:3-oxoacyl-[acyl-carrier-protein] reductase FabG [Halotydeus destructor]
MADREFEGETVLITGSASGIGRSTAELFASKGANLILCDLNETGLKQVSDEIVSKYGVQTFIMAGDLTNRGVCEQLVQDGVAKLGKLDVLVNCAGLAPTGCPVDSPDAMDSFDKLMAVNVRAVYQLCSVASPYLIASKGNIVNISSMSATTPFRNSSAYCIGKAAVSMMTQCLAFELGLKGVRVNEVRPTWTDTPMMDHVVQNKELKDAVLKRFCDKFVPMKKTAKPEDIAKAIVHLASRGQHMVNGLSYPVDAGFSIRGVAFD